MYVPSLRRSFTKADTDHRRVDVCIWKLPEPPK